MICTQFSGHWIKIESLRIHHGCFSEFIAIQLFNATATTLNCISQICCLNVVLISWLAIEGRHPFCFRLDSAVIVIVNILGNRRGEGLKGGIILFKSIEHLIFQSTKEGFHNAVVVTVALSGHAYHGCILRAAAQWNCWFEMGCHWLWEQENQHSAYGCDRKGQRNGNGNRTR